MKRNDFTREERAEISKKFRNEIKAHGVVNAILTVLESQSEKNEVKKQVLAQQCRKKDFAKKFVAACENIRATCPHKKPELRKLSDEILPPQK